eukprot:SRR837773.19263.p1 GENE.SRR837773.19263~~SRR837773.19263.p1  ORF type:complete len:605 (-),score=194.26 SRR837773.19263:95-1882(-)
MVVICRRNPDLVRIYFLLYLLSWIGGGCIFTPIFRTSCRCDRFLQCYVLKSFEDSSQPLINAFAPPNWDWANRLHTRMRVQPLPEKGEPISLEEAYKVAPKADSLLDLTGGEHQNISSVEAAYDLEHVTVRQEDHAGSDALPGAWTKRHKAALRVLSWWRSFSVRQQGKTVNDGAVLGMFYTSPRRFRWVSTSGKESDVRCNGEPIPLAPLEAWMLQSKFDTLRESKLLGKTADIDVGHKKVRTYLEKCFDSRRCNLVRAEVVWGATGALLKVCRMEGTLELRHGPTEEEEKGRFTIEFRREDRRADTSSKAKSAIYDLNTKHLSATESMKRIKGAMGRDCFCDPKRSGCKASGAGDEERYWCWISKDSVSRCVEKGFKVFYSEKRQDYWSEDICNAPTTTCSCTKLGMYPRDEYQLPDRIKSSLWTNKMDFGSSCDTWTATDKLAWCYVGFDSNCVDKFGRGKNDYYKSEKELESAGVLGDGVMPLQFKSSLPCNHESQEEAYGNAMSYCMIVVYGMVAIFALECFVKIPMIFMLHTFLAKRCSDNVVVEEQFDVTFSDDDELYEDDEEGQAETAAPASFGAEPKRKEADSDDD